jgi:sensor histidine kinase YesM
VNLGNYPALKPQQGTISFWVKMESEVWSGEGRKMNSFILTKHSVGDDFYEAYNISYFPEIKKVLAICTMDSSKQVVITSMEKFELFTWHHLAITYNDSSFSFYIDGKPEKKLVKSFETKFLESDSVVVGVTANRKNNRFFHGCIDDIQFYDRVLTDAEIHTLYNAPNPNKNRIILNWILLGLLLLAFLIAVYLSIKYYIRVTLEKQKKQLELINKQLETELRVNRALMNPHFVFNSLNTLQNFILKNENDNAHLYLDKFSKLIRKTLEGNMSDQISLEMEIDLTNRYLEIENLRFEENIQYFITVDPDIVPSITYVPIMMLQPFIENAIWHGLLKKPGEKIITISFSLLGTEYLACTIEDNGLGRKNKEKYSLGKKSLATAFVMQRIHLLNKIHDLSCSLTIEDKPDNQGTIVKIILPIFKKA